MSDDDTTDNALKAEHIAGNMSDILHMAHTEAEEFIPAGGFQDTFDRMAWDAFVRAPFRPGHDWRAQAAEWRAARKH